MAAIRGLVAGNWKMNGLHASSSEVLELIGMLDEEPAACDVLICPPFTLIMPFSNMMQGHGMSVGGQDCHANETGAHTGDISAAMLKDAGCSYVIVGHSERRADHGESDADVLAKAEAVHAAGLCAIICVGETEKQRNAGETLDVVAGQLRGSIPEDANARNTVLAYEPVWAIGTGRTPTAAEVAEVHAIIRKHASGRFPADGAQFRILYGGSVKPSNARELMSVDNVNGALVGGASLLAQDLNGIIDAYR